MTLDPDMIARGVGYYHWMLPNCKEFSRLLSVLLTRSPGPQSMDRFRRASQIATFCPVIFHLEGLGDDPYHPRGLACLSNSADMRPSTHICPVNAMGQKSAVLDIDWSGYVNINVKLARAPQCCDVYDLYSRRFRFRRAAEQALFAWRGRPTWYAGEPRL